MTPSMGRKRRRSSASSSPEFVDNMTYWSAEKGQFVRSRLSANKEEPENGPSAPPILEFAIPEPKPPKIERWHDAQKRNGKIINSHIKKPAGNSDPLGAILERWEKDASFEQSSTSESSNGSRSHCRSKSSGLSPKIPRRSSPEFFANSHTPSSRSDEDKPTELPKMSFAQLEMAVMGRRMEKIEKAFANSKNQFDFARTTAHTGKKTKLLHLAIRQKCDERHKACALVKLLHSKGAALDLLDEDKRTTPLMLAIRHKHNCVLKTLLEAGAPVNQRLGGRDEILKVALRCEASEEVFSVLLKAGAHMSAEFLKEVTDPTMDVAIIGAVNGHRMEVKDCVYRTRVKKLMPYKISKQKLSGLYMISTCDNNVRFTLKISPRKLKDLKPDAKLVFVTTLVNTSHEKYKSSMEGPSPIEKVLVNGVPCTPMTTERCCEGFVFEPRVQKLMIVDLHLREDRKKEPATFAAVQLLALDE
ncbi:hypothetical protein L596_006807 [Steinernema carpocapsae]|uniref:Uncharacterized protein n=1 Tax=Steinernema carpocapsae TaxID=34508 RepID=A0A4U5P7X6_STECR|nr:hypothetical protein L596_006807 [Steinernema carpocapsae]